MTEVEKLDALIAALDEERRSAPADRQTQAEDRSLDGVLDYLKQARAAVQQGQFVNAIKPLEQAKFHIAESWSYRAKLSNDLLTYISGLQRAHHHEL